MKEGNVYVPGAGFRVLLRLEGAKSNTVVAVIPISSNGINKVSYPDLYEQ